MKKQLLHKYFNVETSRKEVEELVDWFETSDRHKLSLFSERELWAAALLHDNDRKQNKEKKKIRLGKAIRQAASAAAVAAITLGLWSIIGNGLKDSRQTVYVPAGQRANLVLADGTSVWLNSNTTLEYPVSFGKKQREVRINGEAFFEVAHNEKCPFIVNTGKYKVEVLGTTFNLNAYSAYGMFETALLEGSVKIHDLAGKHDITLSPGERAVEQNGKLHKQHGLGNDAYGWKNGILAFNDEPIDKVIRQLCAYYDKKIELRNKDLLGYRCTTKFLYNDGLDYILKVLQRDLHYEILQDSASGTIVLQ